MRDTVEALRAIGVEVLRDIEARRPEAVEAALGRLPGANAEFSRRVLMYSGDDDFVRGDAPVQAFVARALARKSVAPAEAANLVREAAHELLVSPRFVDDQISRDGGARKS